jgi:hypothetical protein
VTLWKKLPVSIAAPGVAEAPSAFRVTWAKGPQEPPTPYDIRSFESKFWWPVLDNLDKPKSADDFLNGLASGRPGSLHVLNPTWFWFNGHQPTYDEHFAGRVGGRLVVDHSEESRAKAERGAARIMLCGDVVYFAGGAPAFFGYRSGRPSDASMSLYVGSVSRESGLRLPGPSFEERENARWDGHVFDLAQVDREVALLESRGLSIDLVHKIETVGDVALEGDALHTCADAAVRRLLAASMEISEAYDGLIPDRARNDPSELVPLEICQAVLSEAIHHRWPWDREWGHFTEALTCATNVLRRLELKPVPQLAAKDEEALWSMT